MISTVAYCDEERSVRASESGKGLCVIPHRISLALHAPRLARNAWTESLCIRAEHTRDVMLVHTGTQYVSTGCREVLGPKLHRWEFDGV